MLSRIPFAMAVAGEGNGIVDYVPLLVDFVAHANASAFKTINGNQLLDRTGEVEI